MADVVNQLINTAQQHTVLISLIVFLLTFTKSCAIVSMVIPGTSGLLLLGPLSAGNVGLFAIMWTMASLGAISGFWLSWWIGKYYYHRIRHWRWLKLSIMEKGRVFLQRWGIYAVFLGRFISPLRATVPLASGMSGVTHRQFQLANISSAFIWTFILLVPGAISLGLMAD